MHCEICIKECYVCYNVGKLFSKISYILIITWVKKIYYEILNIKGSRWLFFEIHFLTTFDGHSLPFAIDELLLIGRKQTKL